MTLKGDAKFKGTLTCVLKNDLRNLVNFYASSQKSENLHFDRIVLSKANKVQIKNTEELCFMTTKIDAKFEQKLTIGSKNDMRNLVNFHTTTQNSKNFTSVGYFCPKYMRFELKNTEELSFMTLNSDAKF